MAKEIGFERILLKSNVLIGTFITNQQSEYYQSEAFSRVLSFVQQHKAGAKMTEKNNKLRKIKIHKTLHKVSKNQTFIHLNNLKLAVMTLWVLISSGM